MKRKQLQQIKPVLALVSGLALTAAIQQVHASQWQYQYTDKGLISQIDGPRTDVDDITRYEYNDRGQLIRLTNALGHQIQLGNYTALGQAQQLIDANGVETTLSYDAVGQLISSTLHSQQGDATTRYQYNAVGLVTRITLPDSSYLNYEYDPARRLTAIENNLGERLEYTLDAMGNRTEQRVKEADGSLTQQLSRQYDELGRLLKNVGAAQQTTAYQYDPDHNLLQTTDAEQNPSQHNYDALNRLVSSTDAENQITQLSYNPFDEITEVTDPRGLVTRYSYDNLGRIIERTSPDTGTTTYSYDTAGNLTSSTDAKGTVTDYQYDALNRVTHISYPSQPELNIEYHYDGDGTVVTGERVLGMLTQQTDALGQIQYRYDDRGNLIEKKRSLSHTDLNAEITTGYQWNLTNQLTGMTYPSGLTVQYQRNQAGQVIAVEQSDSSTTHTLLSNISYQPWGGIRELQWGNGLILSRNYDLDGQLIQQQTTDLPALSYQYDQVGNITSITETNSDQSSSDQQYGYDRIYRLTSEDHADWQKNYQYDEVGNRTELAHEYINKDGLTKNKTTTYQYDTDSNQLAKIGRRSVVQDENGHTTAGLINKRRFEYDARQRYSAYYHNEQLKARYHYNGGGERTIKQNYRKKDSKTQLKNNWVYQYNPAGQLISERQYNTQQLLRIDRQYIWLDSLPVAFVEYRYNNKGIKTKEQLAYLHSDHLNTPRVATNADKTTVWEWKSDAFGLGKANTNPDGDKLKTHIALRFPGQQYDGETGLHYNYFRDYDPRTGRYIESDPIGLRGGLNTYGYVGGNPLNHSDSLGLMTDIACQLYPDLVNCDQLAERATVPAAGGPALSGKKKFCPEKGGAAKKLFANLSPKDPILKPSTQKIGNILSQNQSGKFNYVVKQDGTLVLGRSGLNRPNGHINLAQGGKVQAAGEAKFVNGELKYIDNRSGHYKPSGEEARTAALKAFENQGLKPSKGYIERDY